jgi:hypothetical protein
MARSIVEPEAGMRFEWLVGHGCTGKTSWWVREVAWVADDKVFVVGEKGPLWFCSVSYWRTELAEGGIRLLPFTKPSPQTDQPISATIPPSSLKDSGARDVLPTGAMREPSKDRGAYELLPPRAVKRLAVHLERGAKKYAPNNYLKGLPLERFLQSGLRHLFQYLGGDRTEDHLAAALFNVSGAIETEERIVSGELPKDLDALELASKPYKEGVLVP